MNTNISVEFVPNATVSPGKQIMISPPNAIGKGSQGEVVLTWVPSNCTFPDREAIVFQPDTEAPTPWPYSQPTKQTDGTYQVTYTVNTPDTTTYNYNISVISPTHGTTYFRADPDVTNTPE